MCVTVSSGITHNVHQEKGGRPVGVIFGLPGVSTTKR
jgi:hypothetical protein